MALPQTDLQYLFQWRGYIRDRRNIINLPSVSRHILVELSTHWTRPNFEGFAPLDATIQQWTGYTKNTVKAHMQKLCVLQSDLDNMSDACRFYSIAWLIKSDAKTTPGTSKIARHSYKPIIPGRLLDPAFVERSMLDIGRSTVLDPKVSGVDTLGYQELTPTPPRVSGVDTLGYQELTPTPPRVSGVDTLGYQELTPPPPRVSGVDTLGYQELTPYSVMELVKNIINKHSTKLIPMGDYQSQLKSKHALEENVSTFFQWFFSTSELSITDLSADNIFSIVVALSNNTVELLKDIATSTNPDSFDVFCISLNNSIKNNRLNFLRGVCDERF